LSEPLNWPDIRVVPFSTNECPRSEHSGPPNFSWREFYSFRNALLTVLSKYGTIGPMGWIEILDTWKDSEDTWCGGTSKPNFYVVSDMYNDWDRWNRVEASPTVVTESLLRELVAMLLSWPEWCIYMALKKGGLTVFRNRILFEGSLFDGSASIEDLSARCASARGSE
jgi:hypothetical protein